jgi:cyclase
MSRTLLTRGSALLVLAAGAWIAYTQQPPAPLALQKIKDDLYVIAVSTGVGGGNVAVYVTDEGVILVDDMFDRNFDEIMAKVKSVTNKPVKYVLNTHQHDDHAGGNARMMGIAEVIGHGNLRENMIRLKQPGAPRVTYSEEIDVYLGGKEVRARHYWRGHTGGDAIIYFPALKVIHTGDLFLTYPPMPFIDYANGGSALEWTKTLDEVLKTDFEVAIPGHGPVSDRAGLRKFRDDFEKMRNRVAIIVHGGKGKDEVSKALVGEFGWPANGLAIQQVDAFVGEMKQAN